MKKKNIKTTRGGREHDEEAGHDVSEADDYITMESVTDRRLGNSDMK